MSTSGPPGDSHWLLSGTATYYDTGHVGIGLNAPVFPLQVVGGGDTAALVHQIGASPGSSALVALSGAPNGRHNTQQATPTVGTDMENQPARRHQIMTLSRYGQVHRCVGGSCDV